MNSEAVQTGILVVAQVVQHIQRDVADDIYFVVLRDKKNQVELVG